MDINEVQQFGILQHQRHPWELARLEVIFCLICKEFSKPQEKPLIILDIGCGDTFVIEELSRRLSLSKIMAVDTAFDDELLLLFNNQCKNKRIEFYKSIEHIKFNKEKAVDIVLLLDVLEHIENDVNFLRSLLQYKYVGAETQFIITVPAFQRLYSAHDVFLKHYRRYNNSTLKICIHQSGLEISSLGYFFFSLLFPRFFKVLLEKVIQPHIENEKGIGAWNPNRIIDTLTIKLLVSDFKITEFCRRLGVKFAGLSNYAICKKQSS